MMLDVLMKQAMNVIRLHPPRSPHAACAIDPGNLQSKEATPTALSMGYHTATNQVLAADNSS